MGVIKNEVGRPSNKSIMIRRILKLILLLVIVAGVFCAGYYIKDKEDASKKEDNRDNKKINEKFDRKQIKVKTEKDSLGNITESLYFNDKKVDLGGNFYDESGATIHNINIIKDIAVFDVDDISASTLYAINNKGKIIAVIAGNGYDSNRGDYSLIKLSGGLYRGNYTLENNKIILKSDNLGQDLSGVCNSNPNDIMEYNETFEYTNGKLKKIKTVKGKTASELIKSNEILCDEVLNN